jgi:hypothetical protein
MLGRGALSVTVLSTSLVLSAQAFAEPKVEVMADVVHASNQGATDSALFNMKAMFSAEGFGFTSYRRLSSAKLAIQKHKAADIHLPNGQTASVKLDELKDGKAHLRVSVPPGETVYTLGREGSVFVDAGPYKGGSLILVLSPIDSAKP